MRILLQFPEGLKKEAAERAQELEKQGHCVFVSASPCYGACDLALEEAKAVRAEKIVHFGHSEFVKAGIPVEYLEYPMEAEHEKTLSKALAALKGCENIGLVTTVQHARQISDVSKFLAQHGKKVFVGKGARTKYVGQLLGCDVGAAMNLVDKVDCFLYFGGGIFHPLGIRGKRILQVDPFANSVRWLDEEQRAVERKRKAAMSALARAKHVGILVSTKAGQFSLERAEELKEKFAKKKKEAHILVANEIRSEPLENFQSFECYINTACPRLADEHFKRPVVNYEDALEVLELL